MNRLMLSLSLGLLGLAACAPQTTSAPSQPSDQPFTPSGEPVTSAQYRCESGVTASASYFETGVLLTYGDSSYALPQTVAASGARYADAQLEWWTQGEDAFVAHPTTGVIADTCREETAASELDARPDVLNASYLIDGELVALVEGRSSQPLPGTEQQVLTEVARAAFGRLDIFSSDSDEAAVVLRQSAGGSGAFYYLAVLTADPERHIPARMLGENIELLELTVTDSNAALVRYLSHAEGQLAGEAPTLEREEAYLLQDDQLVALSELGK